MHVSGMYVSVHFMQPKSVIFMHKISNDNIEEFAIS